MTQVSDASTERQPCTMRGGPCDRQVTYVRKSTNVLKAGEPPPRKAVWYEDTEAMIVWTPPPGMLYDPETGVDALLLVLSPPILRDAVYRRVGDTSTFVFDGVEERQAYDTMG